MSLTYRTEILIRFNEADPLGIVWHGHYVRYFEDAREAFGKQHGLSYMDFFREGVVVPIVHMDCSFKKSVKFGESIWAEAIYKPCMAAKLQFDYKLYNQKAEVLATGSTVQVFLDKDEQQLQLVNPPFYERWKKENGF